LQKTSKLQFWFFCFCFGFCWSHLSSNISPPQPCSEPKPEEQKTKKTENEKRIHTATQQKKEEPIVLFVFLVQFGLPTIIFNFPSFLRFVTSQDQKEERAEATQGKTEAYGRGTSSSASSP